MIRIRSTGVTLMLACSLLYSTGSSADSYRCGNRIVRTGDSVSDLVRVCGEPRMKSAGSSAVKIDGVSRKVHVERWHYKRGRRSLEHIVLVYRGKIAAIELGRR